MSHGGKVSKSSKTENKKKPPQKSGPTSAEYVVDSDSDVEATVEQTPASSKTNSIHAHKLEPINNLKRKAADISGSGDSRSSKTVSEAKDHRGTSKESPTKKVQLNGESQRKSEEDKARLSSSSRSSSEESSTSAQQPSSASKKPGLDLELPSTSEHDVEDESTDESEDETGEDRDGDTSSMTGTITATAIPSANDVVILPPFQPPKGFSSCSINSDHTARVRSIFSEENLLGKEIWHFTLPSSLHIEDIESFTKSDMLNGKSILTHQGVDYCFGLESGQVAKSKVLIPTWQGNKYQPITKFIHQAMHLRQIISIPSANSGHVLGRSGTISGARKPILKQPGGLKLGYPPFGDTETRVNGKAAVKQAKQRIDNTKIPVPTEPLPTTKKVKKSKKASAIEEPTEWVDPEAYSAPVVIGSTSQHTIEFPSQQDPNGVSSDLQESQLSYIEAEVSTEKAKRKAEKAARKEERRARKQAKASRE